MHLVWDAPPNPLDAVEVTITVLDRPIVPQLYFWALQVGFFDGSKRVGAAHLGIQYHPGYPGAGAVNWGGYDESGRQLGGSLLIPSALDNPNTGDYAWTAGVAYRLRVEPSPVSGWRGSITDTSTGVTTVIRDLLGGGSTLSSPITWSEVFAPCDAPPVAVRWSEPAVVTSDGRRVAIPSARVRYQSVVDGGCSNGSSLPAAGGIDQQTSVLRQVPEGRILRF